MRFVHDKAMNTDGIERTDPRVTACSQAIQIRRSSVSVICNVSWDIFFSGNTA